jgi:8-oxo-dGTP pyrophosphatase MutT (NUDIX family)
LREKNDERIAVSFEREHFGAETPAWSVRDSRQLADCRVFQLRQNSCASPVDGREHDFFVIEAPDWINIIPLTSDKHVVMIEQFRHGTGEVTLEIPGGMVDEGETPGVAALRELLEETGYSAREALFLGKTRPNPAIQNNWIHTFVAPDVSFQSSPVFDSAEHTTVRLVPLADVPALIASGVITHSLVVMGFYWLWLWQQNPALMSR